MVKEGCKLLGSSMGEGGAWLLSKSQGGEQEARRNLNSHLRTVCYWDTQASPGLLKQRHRRMTCPPHRPLTPVIEEILEGEKSLLKDCGT